MADGAALVFARTLYEDLLAGRTFGEAVTNARRHIYGRYRKNNTYGAYQCYGDPGYRLVLGDEQRPTGPRRFYDREQLLATLDNMVSSARVRHRHDERVQELETRLEQIDAGLRPEWRRDGRVLVGLARARAELDQKRAAIDLYTQATLLDSGAVQLQDLEQLSNMRSRLAAEPFLNGSGTDQDRTGAVAQIEASLSALDGMLALGRSSERLSMRASTYKRLASVSAPGEGRQRAIRSMTTDYASAAKLEPDNAYPLLNALAGVLLLGGPSADDSTEEKSGESLFGERGFEAGLAHAEALGAAGHRRGTTFWEKIYLLEARAVRLLYDGSLTDRADDLADAYLQLARDLGSRRQLGSVVDQLSFLIEMARNQDAKGRVERQVSGLTTLKERLVHGARQEEPPGYGVPDAGVYAAD